MTHEFPSDHELDMIEHEAAMAAQRADAALGEFETDGQFDFCEGCPMLNGHHPDEVADAQELTGWSLGGTAGTSRAVINMQLRFEDGTCSKDMLLAIYSGNVLTGRMQQAARASAVEKTRDCDSPKKLPRFLGPLGITSCGALRKNPGLM